MNHMKTQSPKVQNVIKSQAYGPLEGVKHD